MRDRMTQVKFTIESDIVSAFKARCASEGVSMASMISEFMKTGDYRTGKPAKDTTLKIETRPQRRKALAVFIGFLGDMMHNEEQYRDAIPEQFESRYEAADHTCERLAQAISDLDEAY